MSCRCRFALLLLYALVSILPGRAADPEDEQAIRRLIGDREAAWNRGEVENYSLLLTPAADIVSATGRPARGRDAVLALYREQRAGAYKGAVTSTPIDSIRFLRPDVAIVDARFSLSGLRAPDGSALPARRGLLTLVVTKEGSRWLIASMRGIPETPVVPK